MKRLFAGIAVLILSGCLPINTKPVEIYKPPLKPASCNSKIPVSIEVSAPNALDTTRILYEKDGKYLYYEFSEWFCEPACLVEEALKSAIAADGAAPCTLEVEVLDFGPWESKRSFGVMLKALETLKCNGKNRKKLFYYRRQIKKTSLKEASSVMGQLLSKLADDTCKWIGELTRQIGGAPESE